MTAADVDTVVDRLFDTIGNRIPGLFLARQRVWDSDRMLAPGDRDRVVDESVAPATAYWLGYRKAALDLMERLLNEHLTNDDVPWGLRYEVIARLIGRLIAH
jgi:hypothetical protein